jgi:outer membrane protein, heavy metal efflux system
VFIAIRVLVACRRLLRRRARAAFPALLAALALAAPARSHAQLTLAGALEAARSSNPGLRAASEAVAAARGRERQAGALANPTLAYGREQTSRAGLGNAQHIAQLEQPLEVSGQRAARRAAARARRAAAEARLDSERAQLDVAVARAFLAAIAAERRAQLATEAATTLSEAQRVSRERLAAGDVSGYANRRLQLEVARYAAARAAIALERRTSRLALAALMGRTAADGDALALPAQLALAERELPALVSAGGAAQAPMSLDSLVAHAVRARPEARAAAFDAAAAGAEAQLALKERIPIPTLSAGYKEERVADPALGSLSGFRGLVAGLAIPLPIFDRRQGSIEAADADARRLQADLETVRRRIAIEVAEAVAALEAAQAQRDALVPHLGDETRTAIGAVQASYAEGDISLVEWLDAMRAYQDAESTLVTLQAEVVLRRVALARALGTPLLLSSPNSPADR